MVVANNSTLSGTTHKWIVSEKLAFFFFIRQRGIGQWAFTIYTFKYLYIGDKGKPEPEHRILLLNVVESEKKKRKHASKEKPDHVIISSKCPQHQPADEFLITIFPSSLSSFYDLNVNREPTKGQEYIV